MKYAALIYGSVFVPGDERSRTHPGHGYPDRYEDTISIHEFPGGQAEMEAWLVKEQKNKTADRVRLIRYEELEPTTVITVSVAPARASKCIRDGCMSEARIGSTHCVVHGGR